MKKLWSVLVMALLLSGCAEAPVYESMGDVYQVMAPQAAKLTLELPREAALLTMNSDAGDLYFCDGYILTVQTLAGGDLDRSLRTLTGYGRDMLTLLETRHPDGIRWECVWTGAGEGGDQVGRLLLMDDGNCHYAVTVMAPASEAGALRLTWDTLFASVSLDRTAA
ncbi:MAG: hypothetical protein IKC09_03305 [Oscillospiraceae bacterium]|nr:hypothetical protein [Oscillospiraceae bacterium]